jgi:hypothetical protein
VRLELQAFATFLEQRARTDEDLNL